MGFANGRKVKIEYQELANIGEKKPYREIKLDQVLKGKCFL